MSRDTRDTLDMFNRNSDRGRFGDSESIRGNDSVRSNLCDLDLILHNDNPTKQAIAVSLRGDTPFAQWVWLPRSMIEYEKTGIGAGGIALVRVMLPEPLAKEKGLI
jgi:hypothetical protein